jgi:uncharacterized damage-inducible protein DinB
MTLLDFISLYSYNDWANDQLLNVMRTLPAEAFTRPMGSSFSSIRDTFSHIVAGEWIWLERWSGRIPTAAPEWLSSTDLEVLAGKLTDVQQRRRKLLQELDEQRLSSTLSFKFLDGTPDAYVLHDLLLHVFTHSTYHRGQLVTLIRQVGGTPVGTDYVDYVSEKRPL